MAKEKNISIDDARALVADEALWPRMRDFLWDFTPQIHASWLYSSDQIDKFCDVMERSSGKKQTPTDN